MSDSPITSPEDIPPRRFIVTIVADGYDDETFATLMSELTELAKGRPGIAMHMAVEPADPIAVSTERLLEIRKRLETEASEASDRWCDLKEMYDRDRRTPYFDSAKCEADLERLSKESDAAYARLNEFDAVLARVSL